MDGNYSAVRPIVWARADTVVWLDLPRRTVIRQVVWRTLRRAVTRQELWNGNRESLRNFLTWDPEESIISWAWHNHGKYRDRYGAAAADPAYAHLTFVRLTSRGAITRFLAESGRRPPDAVSVIDQSRRALPSWGRRKRHTARYRGRRLQAMPCGKIRATPGSGCRRRRRSARRDEFLVSGAQ